MTPTQPDSRPRSRLTLFWLLIILLIAGTLRLVQPNVYIMWIDEISIHHDAVTFARFGGEWPLLGNISTWGPLAFHSPLTTYVIALPYLLSPDPAVARLFIGVLGTLTVAIVFWMTKRYFGLTAAVITGLLCAVFPPLADWSRFVWNPNVGQPLLALWFFTALLGYYEGKGWARFLHWLILALVIQAQAALGTLLPVSIVLMLYHTWRTPGQRRQVILDTLMGIAVAALTFIPWVVGLSRVERDTTASITLNMPDVNLIAGDFAGLVGATDFPTRIGWHSDPSGIWSETPVHVAGWLQIGIVLAGMLWLLWRWRKAGLAGFPGGFLVVMGLYPFAIHLARAPGQILPHFYFMAVTMAAMPILGIVLARWWKRLWLVALPVILLLLTANAALVIDYIDWLARHGGDYPVGSLASNKSEIEDWLRLGEDIIVLREPEVYGNLQLPDRYGDDEINLVWDILSAKYPIRFVSDPSRLPVAGGGEILTAYHTSPTLQSYIDQGLPHGARRNDRYEWVLVTPDDLPTPTIIPDGADTFAGKLKILGAASSEAPRPGEEWAIHLLWTPLVDDVSEDIQLSLRLLHVDETRYGQVDGGTLARDMWRKGDVVLSAFTLPVADSLPADGPLSLEIIAYTYPTVQNLDVTDAEGNAVSWRVVMPLGD